MRALVLLVLFVVATALAGCHEKEPIAPPGKEPGDVSPTPTNETATPVIFLEGFEEDLSGWEKGSDVPNDPNGDGPVAWDIQISDARAKDGDQSVNLTLDGRQDDGTIWIVHAIPIVNGTRYTANVSVHAWSASESFNTIAHLVMRLAPEPPEGEISFPSPGTSGQDSPTSAGLRQPLNAAEGWQEYAFDWETPEFEETQLYVAIGITAVWETEMSYHIDEVTVELQPLG